VSKGPSRKGFARRPVRRPQTGINWPIVLIVVAVIVALAMYVWPLVFSRVADWWTPTLRFADPTPFLPR